MGSHTQLKAEEETKTSEARSANLSKFVVSDLKFEI